jgi:hypothetical protein
LLELIGVLYSAYTANHFLSLLSDKGNLDLLLCMVALEFRRYENAIAVPLLLQPYNTSIWQGLAKNRAPFCRSFCRLDMGKLFPYRQILPGRKTHIHRPLPRHFTGSLEPQRTQRKPFILRCQYIGETAPMYWHAIPPDSSSLSTSGGKGGTPLRTLRLER